MGWLMGIIQKISRKLCLGTQQMLVHIFRAPNLALIPNTSGKMGIPEMKYWYEKILLEIVDDPPNPNLVLWDSCSTHKKTHFANVSNPTNKNILFENIPEDTTGLIQPWGKTSKIFVFLQCQFRCDGLSTYKGNGKKNSGSTHF